MQDPLEQQNLAASQPDIVNQLHGIIEKLPEAQPQVKAKSASGAAAVKPKQDRAVMFAKRDSNGDGQLSREEFLARQPDPDAAPKRFITFDVNKDGVLSREEFVTSGKSK